MKKLFTTLLLMLAITSSYAQQYRKDTFTTPTGKDVTITCIKHGSFEISFDGTEIQVDPVTDGALPMTDYSTFPKANIILITHEHQDHFDLQAIGSLRHPATVIYEPASVYNRWYNGFEMSNGDSVYISESIQLKAVPAYNTTSGHEQFHPKGRDNGYILMLDGFRIYIAGDTEDIPEMAELGPIDVAFLPCNQPYTMTTDQLINAAKMIRPKVLFPYHYGNTPIAKVPMMLAGSGIDVRVRDYK